MDKDEVEKTMKPSHFASELDQCMGVLDDLKNDKNSGFFQMPVDPVQLEVPDYFEIIKKPMDLQTVEKNLRGNRYANAHEFFDDLLLIFKNAVDYNDDPNNIVHQAALNLRRKMETRLSRLRTSLVDRTRPKDQTGKVKSETRQKIWEIIQQVRSAQETHEIFLFFYEKCPNAFELGGDGNYQIRLDRISEESAQEYLQKKMKKKKDNRSVEREFVAFIEDYALCE